MLQRKHYKRRWRLGWCFIFSVIWSLVNLFMICKSFCIHFRLSFSNEQHICLSLVYFYLKSISFSSTPHPRPPTSWRPGDEHRFDLRDIDLCRFCAYQSVRWPWQITTSQRYIFGDNRTSSWPAINVNIHTLYLIY